MKTDTRQGGVDTGTLGLRSVLVGSLPAALTTDDAPDRYTVEAVFTRRPDRAEIVEILGSATRETLARAGYPTVELTVSDRRLEIANTHLVELRDGLATVLADRLAEISETVRVEREAAAIWFEEAAVHMQLRAAAVAALAESVRFTVSHDHPPQPARSDPAMGTADDRAQLDGWTGEGGRGR